MSDFPSVRDVIQRRRTTKVLAESPLPYEAGRPSYLDSLIEAAGWAPFHRACEEQYREGSGYGIEPWRLYCLEASTCRSLADNLPKAESGKIPAMLRAAEALIMATWLPNQPIDRETPKLFEATLGNMEHIAAASAAIQNLLLAATAQGIENYWSSGGVLRSPATFEKLDIPLNEILLGAIFLFPSDAAGAEVVGSKLRDKRSEARHWARVVHLSPEL
ncbi:MAG: nitroreductase family protein [Planctomycetota bacterium]